MVIQPPILQSHLIGKYIICGRMETNDHHDNTLTSGFVLQADDQMRVEDVRLIRNSYGDDSQKVGSVACKFYSGTNTIYGAFVSDHYVGQFEISLAAGDSLNPISSVYLDAISDHTLIGYNSFPNNAFTYTMTEFYENDSRGIMITCKNSTSSTANFIKMQSTGRNYYVSTRMGYNSGSAIWTLMVDVNNTDPSK